MQKLKNSVLDRMIEEKLTSKEIDFLIYVSRYQDDSGKVSGIHYKELCETMHMSFQGFYDVKQSLQEKGFIDVEKSNRIDHDITILQNGYADMNDIVEGYVNTNHHIFYDEEFFRLKAGSKLLAMELLRMSYAGTGGEKGQFRIGTKRFYEKYTKMFSVTKRVMRTYLMELKRFFSIGIVEGMYYMRPKISVYKQPGQASENENYAAHNVSMICRRNKIKDPHKKDLKDVMDLVRQYKKEAERVKRNIFDLLRQAIEKSLQILNDGSEVIKNRILKPKLIHSILKRELAV